MADVNLADLTSWLQVPQGQSSWNSEVLDSRISDVASLVFPDDVCRTVGLSVLEDAVAQGLLGPPEAAHSILSNTQLFGQEDAPVCSSHTEHPSRVELERDPAHHPCNVLFRWQGRFEKALFDSAHVTHISMLMAATARLFFSWLPSIPFMMEFGFFYALLLVVCANQCAVRNKLRRSFGLSVSNGILHLIVLISSGVLLPLPFGLASSSVTHLAALGIMLTCYVQPYMWRLFSQLMALSLVLWDGYLSSGDTDISSVRSVGSLPSSTALTLALCLLLSSFMAETVKYTKRKSYSGK